VLAAAYGQLNFRVLKESVFLPRRRARWCAGFSSGPAFSGAFALLGGQEVVDTWVKSLDMTPIQFMIRPSSSSSCWAGPWSGPRSSSSSCRSSCRCSHTSTWIRSSSPAGGPQPADGVPVPARGHGRLLPEGCVAAARSLNQSSGDVAIHGDPDSRPGLLYVFPGSGCGCRLWCTSKRQE